MMPSETQPNAKRAPNEHIWFIRLMSSLNGAGAGFGVLDIHHLGSRRRYAAAGRFCGSQPLILVHPVNE